MKLDILHTRPCSTSTRYACGCSVLAWHWQRTWTGVGYASKPGSRKQTRFVYDSLKQTQHSGSAEGTQACGHCAHFVTMCASGKTASLLHETCEQALCEARPRGTAFSGNYC